jgi:uncharacterized coiled-coil protein SlyX
MARAEKEDKVRVVFSSIVERIAEYERKLAEYETQVRELKAKVAKYKSLNEDLQAKTAALAERLSEYDRLTDGLAKVVRNPSILRKYAKKR